MERQKKAPFLNNKNTVFKQCIKDLQLFANALDDQNAKNNLLLQIQNDQKILNKAVEIKVNYKPEKKDIIINVFNRNNIKGYLRNGSPKYAEILHVTLHFDVNFKGVSETGAFHAKVGHEAKAPKLRFIFDYTRDTAQPYLHIVSEIEKGSQYPPDTQKLIQNRTFNTLDNESDRQLAIVIMKWISNILPAHVYNRNTESAAFNRCTTIGEVVEAPAPQPVREEPQPVAISYTVPEKVYTDDEKAFRSAFNTFMKQLITFRNDSGLATPFVGEIKDIFTNNFNENKKEKLLRRSRITEQSELDKLKHTFNEFKTKMNKLSESNYTNEQIYELINENVLGLLRKRKILEREEENHLSSSNEGSNFSQASTITALNSYPVSNSQGSNSQGSLYQELNAQPSNNSAITIKTASSKKSKKTGKQKKKGGRRQTRRVRKH